MNIAVKALFQYKSKEDINLIVEKEFFDLCVKECKGLTAPNWSYRSALRMYIVKNVLDKPMFVRVGDVRVFTAKTAKYCGVAPNEHSS